MSRCWARACAVLAASFAFSATRPALARGCQETSDTVGEQRCSRYGDTWSIEGRLPFTSYFGVRYGELSTAGTSWREAAQKGQSESYRRYRFAGESLAASSLSGFGVHGGFSYFLVGQLYAGGEGAFMLGSTTTPAIVTDDGRVVGDSGSGADVNLWHVGAALGYRIPLGRVSLRGEALLGAMSATIHQTIFAETHTKTSAIAWRALIEPRVAVDVWLTQHISFGGYAGVNMLDASSRAFALTLTWHHRAFDGDMSIW